MKDVIRIYFPFEPVPKGRPRMGRGHAYTPEKTRRFERAIQLFAESTRGKILLDGPLKVGLRFYLKAPKRRKNSLPITRPDLDNLIKSVTDSLNGIFWHDDSQIVEISARKVYSWVDVIPGIEMEVERATTSKVALDARI